MHFDPVEKQIISRWLVVGDLNVSPRRQAVRHPVWHRQRLRRRQDDGRVRLGAANTARAAESRARDVRRRREETTPRNVSVAFEAALFMMSVLLLMMMLLLWFLLLLLMRHVTRSLVTLVSLQYHHYCYN